MNNQNIKLGDEKDIAFAINAAKKYIRNLIQGEGISMADFKSIVKAEVQEYTKDMLKKYLNASEPFDAMVKRVIFNECKRQINELMNKQYHTSPTNIEKLVQNTINEEVKKVIQKNFKITLNDEQVI